MTKRKAHLQIALFDQGNSSIRQNYNTTTVVALLEFAQQAFAPSTSPESTTKSKGRRPPSSFTELGR